MIVRGRLPQRSAAADGASQRPERRGLSGVRDSLGGAGGIDAIKRLDNIAIRVVN